MNDTSGIFVVFEGIDGAGKTTQAELLATFLDSVGEPIVRSKEPTDGIWGRKIRKSAQHGRLSLDEELQAFIEDRREHLDNVISPALAAGKTIILDRYYYSTIAYQGSRGGNIKSVTARATSDVPVPDLVFLLDVSPRIGLSRVNGRGRPNAFEKVENLRLARAAFLQIIRPLKHAIVIDGTLSVEYIHQQVLRATLYGINGRRGLLPLAPSREFFRAMREAGWKA